MSINLHGTIKVIIGLGNPGKSYYLQRHSIGYRIIDAFAESVNALWLDKKPLWLAETVIGNSKVMLIKSKTFMNNSGEVIPFIKQKGVSPSEILVIHDELEKPFGFVDFSYGGSHKGHNGLKSIISYLGNDFWRLKIGIGRPLDKAMVPDYVLAPFDENVSEVEKIINMSKLKIFNIFAFL